MGIINVYDEITTENQKKRKTEIKGIFT